MRKQEPYWVFVKTLLLLFAAGLAMGAVAVDVLADFSSQRAGILSDYFLRQYKYLKVNVSELFFFILGKRMKWIILLWLTGFTPAGIPCVVVYALWCGFSLGTLLGISILKFGGRGMLFCAAAFFPQAMVYIPVWTVFLYGICRYADGHRGGKQQHMKNGIGAYVLLLAGVCLCMIFGILMESSLSPWCVRQIIRIW